MFIQLLCSKLLYVGDRFQEEMETEDASIQERQTPLDPTYRPLPKLVKLPIPEIPRSLSDFYPEISMDFKENSPFQEGVISEMYQRPDKSYFQEPHEWIV